MPRSEILQTIDRLRRDFIMHNPHVPDTIFANIDLSNEIRSAMSNFNAIGVNFNNTEEEFRYYGMKVYFVYNFPLRSLFVMRTDGMTSMCTIAPPVPRNESEIEFMSRYSSVGLSDWAQNPFHTPRKYEDIKKAPRKSNNKEAIEDIDKVLSKI